MVAVVHFWLRRGGTCFLSCGSGGLHFSGGCCSTLTGSSCCNPFLCSARLFHAQGTSFCCPTILVSVQSCFGGSRQVAGLWCLHCASSLMAGYSWIVHDRSAPNRPLDSVVLSSLKLSSAMNEFKKMSLRENFFSKKSET